MKDLLKISLTGSGVFSLTPVQEVCNPTGFYTEVVLDIIIQPEAGADSTGEFCEDAGAIYYLTALLSGADVGGVWMQTEETTVNIDDPNSVDFNSVGPGDFIFTYIYVARGSCLTDEVVPTIEIEPSCVYIDAFVYQEGGVIVPQTGVYALPVRTTLNNSRLLSGQYSQGVFMGNLDQPVLGAIGQFYNRVPCNYAGTEGRNFGSHSMSAGVGYAPIGGGLGLQVGRLQHGWRRKCAGFIYVDNECARLHECEKKIPLLKKRR